MSKSRLLLLSMLVAVTAGCGLGKAPGMANARGAAGLGARNLDGYEKPVVLEDFDTVENNYDRIGPINHPFFEPMVFTPVKTSGSTSSMLELLAPMQNKPRKGILFTEDVEDPGSFTKEVNEKPVYAKGARVSFRWGVNAQAAADPSILAQVVFQFKSLRLGTRAIAYAWTNAYCPGTVLASQIGSGEDAIPMRVICLQMGNGQGAVCSEASLAKIQTVAVDRDFDADVRWAWGDKVRLTEPGVAVQAADQQCSPVAFPPADVVNGLDGREVDNKDLTGITGLGFGAEVAKGICAHSVVDDVQVQLRW